MTFEYFKNEQGEFVCPHCQSVKKNQSTMNMHYKAKHSGDLKHQCEHCPNKFSQKCMLENHMKAAHKDILEKQNTPVETLECPCKGCDYKDMRKGNLRIHFARIHLKELTESLKGPDLSCKACSKSFKSATAFYYHAWGCVKPVQTHAHFNAWEVLRAL